jgi:hypothetical protein
MVHQWSDVTQRTVWYPLNRKRPIRDLVAIALFGVHEIVWRTRGQKATRAFQMEPQRLLGPLGL